MEEREGGKEGRVGFLEEASFGDLFRGWKVGWSGRWALCVLLSSSRYLATGLFLSRFRLPISPVLENFFRGCLRSPASLLGDKRESVSAVYLL